MFSRRKPEASWGGQSRCEGEDATGDQSLRSGLKGRGSLVSGCGPGCLRLCLPVHCHQRDGQAVAGAQEASSVPLRSRGDCVWWQQHFISNRKCCSAFQVLDKMARTLPCSPERRQVGILSFPWKQEGRGRETCIHTGQEPFPAP